MRAHALVITLALAAPALADPPKVAIPLPDRDFDVTEVAVPWKALTDAGYQVVFATERGPDGPVPACDPRLLDDPTLRVFNLVARPANRELYARMAESPAFRAPIRWSEIDPAATAGIVLPGGHWKRGMRQCLEATTVQEKVLAFFRLDKPVGAICHGGVVLARTVDPASGESVVKGRRLTALLQSSELGAWFLTKLWLGDYYRTYDQTVEAEVRAAGAEFERGPPPNLLYQPGDAGFVVQDRNLVTARWPGDASSFAAAFVALLREKAPVGGIAASLEQR